MTTPDPYDVIVAGGGPAGATIAGLLAKRNLRVLVLEADRFPRYHIGESMITGMLSVIEELGLTEQLDAKGFPRKYGISFMWGAEQQPWNVRFSETGPYDYSYHVRRDEFDELLLNRAAELGAEVRQQCTVKEPLVEGDRVVGVRYTDPDGQPQQARARFVVDASANSRVIGRRFTDVTWRDDLRNIAVWTYYDPYHQLPEGQTGNIVVESVPEGWMWGIPVSETKMSVGYVTAVTSYKQTGLDPADLFAKRLGESHVLRDLLRDGQQVDKFRTTRDWSYTSDKFHGPGWLVLGDAAAFIDPLFSTGVWLGMMGAWVASRCLDILLRDPSREQRLLDGYERAYRSLVDDMTQYVRFFYDPRRQREDYLQRAQAAQQTVLGSTEPRLAFIAMVSGVAALPRLAELPELQDAPTH